MNKRLVVLPIVLSICSACRDIGQGGTGELVVPRSTLREVQAVDPSAYVTAPPTTQPSTEPSTRAVPQRLEEVQLSVEQVRELALRNNLDIGVTVISPAIALQTLNQEEARYEAVFTTSAGYSQSNTPTATLLEGSETQGINVRPGIEFPLRTGGLLQFAVPMNRFETDNEFATLNPSYSSDFVASLNQPLLRNGGIYVNAQSIRVAFYGYQRQQALTKLEVIRVLANADRVYWRLYATREALRVRRQEYDLAVQQLDRARVLVEAETVASVEIDRAQAGVADRVEAIITTQNLVLETERDLKRIINEAGLDMQSQTAIIPATPPTPQYFNINPQRLVQRAMEGRMELLESELNIAQAAADIRVARNGMLPLVTLQYNYTINGLGSSLDDSFNMVGDADFRDHFVGLQVEIPLGNEAARSNLRRAMLRRLQELATREQRELQIRQEVLTAADRLELNWQRILAARQRVRLNQRLVEQQIEQFEQGLQTSTEVLQAQSDLANAQLSEIAALADYQITQVDIAFATGTLLGKSRILWEPVPPPKP
jgi:outer membrane protein TolC